MINHKGISSASPLALVSWSAEQVGLQVFAASMKVGDGGRPALLGMDFQGPPRVEAAHPRVGMERVRPPSFPIIFSYFVSPGACLSGSGSGGLVGSVVIVFFVIVKARPLVG